MSRINTISEFLLHGATDYRIFDMGRAIRSISSQTFLDFELNQIAAPYPRQQHAWFGIVFFNQGLNQEHFIWFIKLPLDEQSKLVSAARNQFLQIVVEALGSQSGKNDKTQNSLPDNPFTFTPNQQQLASFNSLSRQQLGLAPSQYFALAQQYLLSPQNTNWQQISLQGIADLSAKINQEPVKSLLIQQFPHLAYEVQIALCEVLENHPVNAALSKVLIKQWYKQATQQNYLLAMLRALSQCDDAELVKALLIDILGQDQLISDNLLVLIAARHWQRLADEQLIKLFIHRLSHAEVDLFVGLFGDLVQIPDCRELMLKVLRWPEKEPALVNRIETLFASQSR